MKNKELVEKIFKRAFEDLTKDLNSIDLHGYKTVELVAPELAQQGIKSIGIGLNESNKIVIFKIDNDYKNTERFRPVFHIAEQAEKYGSEYTYLSIRICREWSDDKYDESNYNYDIGCFKGIYEDLAAVLYVINAIKKAEEELTK